MGLREAYPYILKEYLSIAQKYAASGYTILKTDSFNECRNLPIRGGIAGNVPGTVIMLEIDPATAAVAKKNGFDVRLGDIKNIPLESNSIDLLLDFSTIDHIWEYRKALAEYHRVLRTDGDICIVYWTAPEMKVIDASQVYFEKDDFMESLDEYFELEEERIIFDEPDFKRFQRTLWYYKGFKKQGDE